MFPLGELPTKYIGVPLNSTRLKAARYSPLVDKITDFTKKWTGTNLSYAGRTELIKSVLQGIECYWLQVFPLPGTAINRIFRVARQFMWGSRQAPMAWETLCLPKTEGGLGLRSLKSCNKTLLTRVLWDIFLKKDSLWIKWVHIIYIGQRTFWEWCTRDRDPQLIKSLVAAQDEMLQHHTRAEVETLWATWLQTKGASKAYEWFRPKGEQRYWPKFVWKRYIPPKYSFTTWQAIRGRLSTRDRLTYLDIDRVCPLCSME